MPAWARLALRIGGKIGPLSGDPVDAMWEVRALARDMVMTGLAGTPAQLGDCALVACKGLDVVLTSYRCQAFGLDLFTQCCRFTRSSGRSGPDLPDRS
jgi:microcystin degradation protein MlrC